MTVLGRGPVAPDGLTREHVADPAAAAEAAAEAAADGTLGAGGLGAGNFGGAEPGTQTKHAAEKVGWGRRRMGRRLLALPKKKPPKPKTGFGKLLAKVRSLGCGFLVCTRVVAFGRVRPCVCKCASVCVFSVAFERGISGFKT